MRLTRLEISGVRNLTSVAIDCSPSLNLFTGPNGAGKTSLIEAVHVLARGRSFRSASIASVIHHDRESLMVFAAFDDEHRGKVNAGVVRHRNNRSELHLNGAVERRLSEVARLMPIQLILPDSSALILGAPTERRRFLDWGTFHVEPAYLDRLRDYQRVLQQRNALLKSRRDAIPDFSRQLLSWTRRLVTLGDQVDASRRAYLDAIGPVILSKLDELASGFAVALSYRPGWREGESLENCLGEGEARDVKSGVTHYGPHRADLRVMIGEELAADTLSRGQAKIVASAFRLAQAALTSEIAGRRSLFLIDDIGAELDADHNARFFRALKAMNSQVFATATSEMALGLAFAGSERKLFHVEQGACHPIGTEGL
jgi:DNA replication and repair protein RecF